MLEQDCPEGQALVSAETEPCFSKNGMHEKEIDWVPSHLKDSMAYELSSPAK